MRWSTTVNYMWLDPEQCCWSTMAAAVYKTQYVFGVSLTKWEAYLLGGKSSQHDQSTRSIIELQTNVRKNFTLLHYFTKISSYSTIFIFSLYQRICV